MFVVSVKYVIPMGWILRHERQTVSRFIWMP